MQTLPMLDRRGFLIASAGASWLSDVAAALRSEAATTPVRARPPAIICLWLTGGPSQLETFDPHPGKEISYGTAAVATRQSGVLLARGLHRLAEQMDSISLVRNMVNKEADHVRGGYLMKTGYSPDLTVQHPSIGALVSHETSAGPSELPRFISLLGRNPLIFHLPGRGGFLGGRFDAFYLEDPLGPLPNVAPLVDDVRRRRRLANLAEVERRFHQRHRRSLELPESDDVVGQALRMMESRQLRAFHVAEEPAETLERYGRTPFGRACLAARRLVEAGVPAVEATLDGWDSHVDNHDVHQTLNAVLDPAFSSLVEDLKDRDLLNQTLVLCAGEFGRTPTLNVRAGRDHWNRGFSVAITGAGIRRGVVVGETDPSGGPIRRGYTFADLYATVLQALGIDPSKELSPSPGRRSKLSQGRMIEPLLRRES